MSNKERLENYLLKERTFLLDDINNGKTIMISGAWGAGKTHFWKEEIAKEQKKVQKDGKEVNKYTAEEYNEGLHSKLKGKEKACVYVSLYGKTSIEAIELDVYMKAYQNIVGDADLVSKTCSVFTNVGKNLGNMAHKGAGGAFSWIENLVDKDKFDKAGKYLENGGVVCFDDFERKSKEIDLNDLFGFISQLALEYRCKVIIILNSDVFKGKEAEIFKNVKEKTVNKFLYFEPTIEELFNSIAKDEKYSILYDYKSDILKAIEETEELNARIYIQVLDNCLEWLIVKASLDAKIVRVLVLGTFNFVLNHMVLDYQEIDFKEFRIRNSGFASNDTSTHGILQYNIVEFYSSIFKGYNKIAAKTNIAYRQKVSRQSEGNFLKSLKLKVTKVNTDKNSIISEKNQEEHLYWINENEQKLKALWKYGYRLYYVADVDEETYNEIAQFIKSGILI
ncbi:MAG: Unknown protein [uncultured Sulfurovum sp.]|uniref:KAP NTPase domain-containing protein n=1 Tax=uncultured Sulfurovum sp. TaxID=269237 RepID=A0A6S6T8S2_9BACT|nr:MAG: Unknown protein [uncultured Sulfurovum sp.]